MLTARQACYPDERTAIRQFVGAEFAKHTVPIACWEDQTLASAGLLDVRPTDAVLRWFPEKIAHQTLEPILEKAERLVASMGKATVVLGNGVTAGSALLSRLTDSGYAPYDVANSYEISMASALAHYQRRRNNRNQTATVQLAGIADWDEIQHLARQRMGQQFSFAAKTYVDQSFVIKDQGQLRAGLLVRIEGSTAIVDGHFVNGFRRDALALREVAIQHCVSTGLQRIRFLAARGQRSTAATGRDLNGRVVSQKLYLEKSLKTTAD